MRYPALRLLGAVVLDDDGPRRVQRRWQRNEQRRAHERIDDDRARGGHHHHGRSTTLDISRRRVRHAEGRGERPVRPEHVRRRRRVRHRARPGLPTAGSSSPSAQARSRSPPGARSRTFTTVRRSRPTATAATANAVCSAWRSAPSFATDHFVYAFYSRNDFTTQVVVRFTECAGVASDADHARHAAVGRRLLPQGRPAGVRPRRQALRHARRRALGHRRHGRPARRRCRRTRTTSAARSCATNPTDRSRPTTRSGRTPVWVAGLRNPFGIAFDHGRATRSSRRTGRRATSAHRRPATTSRSVSKRAAGTSGPRATATRISYPGATSCLGRPEPEWSSEKLDDRADRRDVGRRRRSRRPYAGHFVFCSTSGMRVFTPGSPHATVTNGPSECHFDVQARARPRPLLLRRDEDLPSRGDMTTCTPTASPADNTRVVLRRCVAYTIDVSLIAVALAIVDLGDRRRSPRAATAIRSPPDARASRTTTRRSS